MQLIYSTEVSLFCSVIRDHVNTVIPSWYGFENSIVVGNSSLCLQPIMNSIFSSSSSCSMTESHLQHLIVYSVVQESYHILLSITNKMQRYTIFFIAADALRVSGRFSSHHQELKTVHTASGICLAFSASYRYRE
jgi:hypothetical protein